MKLFVVWSDYDMTGCEEFPEENAECRARVTKIMRDEDEQVNGTHLLAVIEGDKLIPEIVQRVNGVCFNKQGG